MSKSCCTIRRRATPVRSSPNSRLARNGIRNCSIVEYASATSPPSAKTSGTSDAPSHSTSWRSVGLAAAPLVICRAKRGCGPSCAGSADRSFGMTRTPMSWGAQVSKSAVFQGRLDGKAPIMMTPQSMPIIAESSYAFSADARLLPDWKRRIAVSPLIMLSAWPSPISNRPSTRIGNPPPLVRPSETIASTSGPSHIARRRLWVRKRPSRTSDTMRAKPNAPATKPSCQSASAAPRAMSGRTAGKAPPEKMLEKVITQSRAVRDVTRPFMVNHCTVTSATTISLEVQGRVSRMTFDRPEVLNAGNAQFAADLGRAVAAIDARDGVRVVVMTGAGRAFQTGVDLKALAAGELTQPDLIAWEDAMTAIERMDRLVIAAINGHCIGGGLQLALVCDYRLAVEEALLSLPAVKECLIPSMALYRLPRLIGLARAKELI